MKLFCFQTCEVQLVYLCLIKAVCGWMFVRVHERGRIYLYHVTLHLCFRSIQAHHKHVCYLKIKQFDLNMYFKICCATCGCNLREYRFNCWSGFNNKL